MNKERLLNVAKALRESRNPENFDMALYGHKCGSPCCALGHYADRTDLQTMFVLNAEGELCYAPRYASGRDPDDPDDYAGYTDPKTLNHFGLTREEARDLFAASGCGNAETALEAAEYIEAFVARIEAEAS